MLDRDCLYIYLNRGSKMENCLSDEIIACLAEGLLRADDLIKAQQHIKECSLCSEILQAQESCIRAKERGEFNYVPAGLMRRIQGVLPQPQLLDIFISFTEKTFEALKTTGELLLAPSMRASPILRGADESSPIIVVREIFENIQIFAEVTKNHNSFRVILKTLDAGIQTPIEDIRSTLLLNDLELESYITVNGRAVFESLTENDYAIQITKEDKLIGVIRLHLKKV